MLLCAYSIGAPIGAGLISREKHYHPLSCKDFIPEHSSDMTEVFEYLADFLIYTHFRDRTIFTILTSKDFLDKTHPPHNSFGQKKIIRTLRKQSLCTC